MIRAKFEYYLKGQVIHSTYTFPNYPKGTIDKPISVRVKVEPRDEEIPYEENDLLRWLYYDVTQALQTGGTRFFIGQRSKDFFENLKSNPFRKVRGVTLPGARPDLVIFDDIESAYSSREPV